MSRRKDGHPSGVNGPRSLATPLAEECGLTLAPPDAVIALRIVGADGPDIHLAPTRKSFLLGSDLNDPDVTVKVSSQMRGAPAGKEEVSRVHLLVQRKGTRLWIKDQASTNGTFVDGRKVEDGDIEPGECFRVGKGPWAVTLLAMDEQMSLLRARLQWVLGFTAHAHVDEMLQMIATGEPLLLLGEVGCEQRWLAEQIHATSARRFKGFAAIAPPLAHAAEQTAQLTLASHGTAFMELAAFDRIPAPFVKELFGDTYQVRPIIAATDLSKVSAHLGADRAHRLRIVKIPPIRERREDVPRILNSLFRRPPLEKKRDVAELGDQAVGALMAFNWPDNFDDLRRNAPKLLAYVESGGNKRGAARILNQSHQSIGQALARIGL